MPGPPIAIAFDFGLRRIGVAVGSRVSGTASPLGAVAHRDSGPDWGAIDRLVRDYEPGLLLVGRPYNVDDTPSSLAPASDRFAAALGARYGLLIERVDERYSSLDAGAALRERRREGTRRRRVSRADIDGAAAAIILERWLQATPEGAR